MSQWQQVPDERGLHYGDGVFETIAIRNGKPRLWSYHADRLRSSCARLGLECPVEEELRESLDAAVMATSESTEYGIAKLILTSGSGKRGYARPRPGNEQLYLGIYPARALDRSAYQDGVTTVLCETRLASGSTLAGLKTLNRLEQVLARSELKDSDVFEGLTLDAEDHVICGTMSNVFIVRDNEVQTPSLRRCGVAGVMRRLVMEELERTGAPVIRTELDLNMLENADEVFITNSQLGAVPVRRCGDWHWQVGPVTKQVLKLLANRGIDECRR